MAASDFLDPSKPPVVSKDVNVLWGNIFSYTPEKVDAYFRRCEGIFQTKVSNIVEAGKKPNLYNKADSYRDQDLGLAPPVATPRQLKICSAQARTKSGNPDQLP